MIYYDIAYLIFCLVVIFAVTRSNLIMLKASKSLLNTVKSEILEENKDKLRSFMERNSEKMKIEEIAKQLENKEIRTKVLMGVI